MYKVKIIGISGSPRKDGNTTKLVKRALEGSKSVDGVDTELYQLSRKKIQNCIACHRCLDSGECALKDDFQEFIATYLGADGLLIGSPVYHMSVPASMKAALDRLANVIIYSCLYQKKEMPLFNKICGVLTCGLARFGGQEMTLNFLMNSVLLMNGILVSGNTLQGSYIGVASELPFPQGMSRGERAKSKEIILEDQKALYGAEALGKRIAQMSKIMRAGISVLEKELPAEYFYKVEDLYLK